MSNVWFTSDLHIGHAKVANIRATDAMITQVWDQVFTEGVRRLVPNAAHNIRWHDEMLAMWWDEMVRPQDDVWILGDISSGTAQAQMKALDWLRERPGRKYLILGNHDGPHPMYRDAAKWMKLYSNAGVFEAPPMMSARRRIPRAEGHYTALLSHFPYRRDRPGIEPRHTQWRLPDEGEILLHGHTHESAQSHHLTVSDYDLDTLSTTTEIHVGLDAWEYKPVSLETIADHLERMDA